MLKAYELVPEAYRQRFRNHQKSEKQTYAEAAREQSSLFHRWLAAEAVDNFDSLCNLMIVEQFKSILPERVATYVNEHKVKTVSEASSLANGYILTHLRVTSMNSRRVKIFIGESNQLSSSALVMLTQDLP